jgi:hypothetical protein
MNIHRFAVGERVSITGRQSPVRAPGVYLVVRQLPDLGDGDKQYRLKSESERYERVAAESQLARV